MNSIEINVHCQCWEPFY